MHIDVMVRLRMIAQLVQNLNLRFGNDLLCDSKVMRRHILPTKSIKNTSCLSPNSSQSGSLSFMQFLLNNVTTRNPFDDEGRSFLTATSNEYRQVDFLSGRKQKSKAFSESLLLQEMFR